MEGPRFDFSFLNEFEVEQRTLSERKIEEVMMRAFRRYEALHVARDYLAANSILQ